MNMCKILVFLCMTGCGVAHAHPGNAYCDACHLAINPPQAGKCRELTDEEIEQVRRDEQPGHAYWQTWDVNIPADND